MDEPTRDTSDRSFRPLEYLAPLAAVLVMVLLALVYYAYLQGRPRYEPPPPSDPPAYRLPRGDAS